LIKKKKNEKVIAIKANKQANKGKGAKGDHLNHGEHQECLGPEREVRSSSWGLGKLGCISWDASQWIKFIAKWVSEYFGPKFSTHDKVTSLLHFFVFIYAYLFSLYLVFTLHA
jgi:hypothetical protein